MNKTFALKVLTREGLYYEGQVASIIAPGALGYLGVLYNHAPLVTTCTTGKLVYRESQDGETVSEKSIWIENGFLEVLNNTVTILTDRVSETKPETVIH